MCGVTSPTNPMTPETETQAAVRRLAPISTRWRTRSTLTPSCLACSSPRVMISSSEARNKRSMDPAMKYGNMNPACAHDLPCRLPMIQNTMACTDSSSRALRRDMRAERNVATTIPDNIIVSRRMPPAILEKAMTKKSAPIAPRKLNRGITPNPWSQSGRGNGMIPPRNMARVAPNAAPDATPMVKGSASGFMSTP